jgi:hypothetical protein
MTLANGNAIRLTSTSSAGTAARALSASDVEEARFLADNSSYRIPSLGKQ